MEGKTDDISYCTNAWRDLGLERKEWGVEVKKTSGVLASCPLAVASTNSKDFFPEKKKHKMHERKWW